MSMSDGSYFTKEVLIAVTIGVVAVYYLWNKVSSGNNQHTGGHHPQPVEREKLERLPVGNLTPDQLSKYTGSNKSRILVSVCGRIFDLTKGRDFYGYPDGPYNCFTGGDASYMLGAMSLEKDHKNKKDFTQDGDHQITLSDWISRYRSKYPIVGVCDEFINLCPESWREAGNDVIIPKNIDFKSNKYKLITVDELKESISMDNDNSWISVCGFVFDVKCAEIVYESMYGDFPDAIGSDISYALSINKFDKNETYNKSIDIIKNDKNKILKLKKYLKVFSQTYPIVGKLNIDIYSLDDIEWDIVDQNDDDNDNDDDNKNDDNDNNDDNDDNNVNNNPDVNDNVKNDTDK